mmetsp:Transcript_10411/g.33649  ORF Transcript_10411/g.33649 Transcript_10411/m.33649 type:complete len:119 (-) Transcript_10411:397-753(-)
MSACPMQKVGAITQPMEPLSQNSSSPATVLGSSPVVPTTTLMPKASACLVASWQASGVEKSTSTPCAQGRGRRVELAVALGHGSQDHEQVVKDGHLVCVDARHLPRVLPDLPHVDGPG